LWCVSALWHGRCFILCQKDRVNFARQLSIRNSKASENGHQLLLSECSTSSMAESSQQRHYARSMSHHAHSWCEALQLRVQWDPIAGKFFRDQHGLPGAPSGPSGTNLSSLVNKAQEVGMKSVSFLVSKFLQTCSPPNWGLKHRLVTCDIAAGARKFCYTWNVLLQSRSLTC
jgi:hypothetical protein